MNDLQNTSFILKRFIDDHAIERIETVQEPYIAAYNQLNSDTFLKAKIDSLGWLARSCELVSSVLVQDMINAFKGTVMPQASQEMRDKYIKKTHGSNAAIVAVKRIQ